jgi:hypothetical protein
MSLLKNVVENACASLQEKQFQINRVTCDIYLWGSLKKKSPNSGRTKKQHSPLDFNKFQGRTPRN